MRDSICGAESRLLREIILGYQGQILAKRAQKLEHEIGYDLSAEIRNACHAKMVVMNELSLFEGYG